MSLNNNTENSSRFELVNTSAKLDNGPGRYRIGLVTLSNDYVTELDFMNMRPSNDIAIYTSRLPNTPQCTVETLREMAPHITKATSLILPEGHLDVIAYACTSGTAVMGFKKVQSLIQAVRPNIPCITPLTSSLEALDRFDAQKISVLTPYVDDVNANIIRYLEAHGKSIATFTSFKIMDNEKMARVSPESIYHAALNADRNDADALFISCTAIRAVEVIEKIEQKLGKPVITAVQAMFWQSLRLAGFNGKISGYGQLLCF